MFIDHSNDLDCAENWLAPYGGGAFCYRLVKEEGDKKGTW
jgi:hypothetical protein